MPFVPGLVFGKLSTMVYGVNRCIYHLHCWLFCLAYQFVIQLPKQCRVIIYH